MTAPSSARRGAALRWFGLGLLLLALGAAGWWLWRGPAEPSPSVNVWSGTVPVRAIAARREDLPVELKAIGSVAPLNAVTVRPRVDGLLTRVLFTEGQQVKAGQLLAEIDPQPFRVRLAQAQGQQAQNLAQLKNAEAELATYESLYQQDSIARQQVDKQRALVNQLRGTRQTDQAQVDDARLQLGYTRIEAPIAGRLGLRRVDAGNLVTSAGTEGLTTITQTRPITVVFTVPETQLTAVRLSQRGVSGAKPAPLAVEAWDRGETTRLAQGRLTTFDNQIDAATGTLKLKAQFDNADDALFPNQFVNVRLRVRQLEGVVTIVADAVQHGSKGPYVYAIKDGKATVRPVTLGPTSGDRVVVAKGLAAGEPVVLEGLDRLREGREVVLLDAAGAAPAASTARASASDAR